MTEPEAQGAGVAAFRRRDFAAAEQAFASALAENPGDRDACFNLAMVYEATSRWVDALTSYETLVRRRPEDLEAWIRIGIVHYVQARYREACVAFAAALRVQPAHLRAALNFGVTAVLAGESGDAVRVLQDALARHPESAALWSALADAARVDGQPDEAERAAARALALDPHDVEAHVAVGQLAYARGDFAGADAAFAAARTAGPERYEPPLNLGVLAHGLGQVDRALACCRSALALAPDEPEAHLDYGMSLLLAGELAAGFAELEWRRRLPAHAAREAELRARGLTAWDGRPTERTVAVVRDQGLGDWLLWSRLFPALRRRVGRLVLAAPAALAPLAGEDAAADLVCGEEEAPAADAYVPVCSLPHLLGVAAPDASTVPYVRADPARTAAYRRAFRARGRPAVGLVWAGERSHRLDRFRSCPLAAFAPLAALELTWVSLQVGPRAADAPPAGFELFAPEPPLRDFAATAAAVAALDLVVSVDTAVAHLAGALGRPVWTLHGFGHYWLWGVGRRDSPWYPTMRLFRQSEPGRWDEPIAELRAELERWLAQAGNVSEEERA